MFTRENIAISYHEVAAAMERELTEAEKGRATLLIAQVIEAFQDEAFGELTNYGFGKGTVTHRLRSNKGAVYLPYRNVTRIVSVTSDNGGFDNDWRWREFQPSRVQTRLRTGEFAIVTYEWELAATNDVVSSMADCVARALLVPSNVRTGAQQVTNSTGPYSATENFASWAVGGQALLSPEDKKTARKFRPKFSSRTWVLS